MRPKHGTSTSLWQCPSSAIWTMAWKLSSVGLHQSESPTRAFSADKTIGIARLITYVTWPEAEQAGPGRAASARGT